MTQDQQPDAQPNQPNSDELSGLRDLIEHQPRLAAALGAVVIIVATLLAYIPAMRAGFVWDDDYYVNNNYLLTTWTGLQRIWFDVIPSPADYPLPQYYPMTHTTFWIEYHLWGLDPIGYHTVNIVLHIGSALLVWLILKKLEVPGAWLAATIFALHPLNVESVAWIAERKNVLSLIFYLGSLYVYLRYAGITQGVAPLARAAADPSQPPQIEFGLPDDPQRLYALAAVLFLFALFSKTVANSMPAVALLIIWWKRRRITLKDIQPLLPLFVVGIAMGMLTAYMEKVRVGVALRPWLWDYSPTALGEFGARCIIAGRAIWFYVGKIVFPYPLIFNYPRWQIDPGNIVQYLFPISVLIVLGLLALSRKRLGDGPLVAALYFVITLFPALGFFDVWPMQYSFVADHFAYFSAIGLIALIAAIAAKYLPLEGIAGIAGAIMLVFLGMTWTQSMIYHDAFSLWRDTLAKTNNKSWFALNNYAYWLEHYQGPGANFNPLDESEKRFRQVLDLYREDHANDWTGHREYPEAWLNLADIAEQRGTIIEERQKMLAATSQAASQAASQPTTRSANDYFEEAVADYREALKADPNYFKTHYLLGKRLIAMGRTDEGVAELKRAIELYPKFLDTYQELAALAYRQGKFNDAIEWYSKMIAIDPLSAPLHAALGTILLENGHLSEGLIEWDLAQKFDPDNADMLNTFGAKMAASGYYAKAADYFQQALRIDPQSLEARTNLGVAAARAGFPDQARKAFEEVLKMDPTFTKARENLDALNSGRLQPATRPSTTRRVSSAPASQTTR